MNAIAERQECSQGPVSTLPGHTIRILLVDGERSSIMCDDHPDRVATHRVQGETDSFGCEFHYLCASCTEAVRIARLEPKDGYCEWHKSEGRNLRAFRDMDEGMAGPVYMTCQSCRDKVHKAAAEELADRYSEPDVDYYDDSDNDDREIMDEDMSDFRHIEPSRVRRASPRIRALGRKMAREGANPDYSRYQGATLRACIRHFSYYGGF